MDKYCLMGALVIAAIGAVKDVRGRTIPNWLTYSGISSGLALRVVVGGWPTFRTGLLGLLIGGGLFYLLFVVGGMGGGDVKLMAAVGVWAGVPQTIYILMMAALAGGVLATVYMVRRKQIRLVLGNSLELLRHHLATGLQPHPVLNIREPDSMRIPYGLAIAIGTVFCAGSVLWRG